MRTILHTTLLLVGLCGLVQAQDGLALMKVDPGARPTGMGGAFVAMTADPHASFYNPAASTGTPKFTLSLGHNTYWENVRLETGYLVSPLADRIAISVGLRMASVDDIESRQFPTLDPDSYFEARDIAIKAGLSYAYNDKFALGLAVGYMFEKIDVYRGGGLSIDLGGIYTVDTTTTIGAAITNIGPSFGLSLRNSDIIGRDIPQPTTWRLGVVHRRWSARGALDLVIIDDKLRTHIGGEYPLHRQLSLRAGYMINYDTKNFTAGASFSRRNVTLDYAFVPFTRDLGTSHLFNLTISL